MELRFRVNGALRELRLDPRVTLLDALRERLNKRAPGSGCDALNDARVALGGLATVPWRSRAAEDVLRGARAGPEAYAAAAEAALVGARPRPGNAFKVELGKRTIVRALSLVAGLPE